MNSGRWWEFYLVRYFIGTVVGTLIIIYLANKKDSFLAGILIDNKLIVIGSEGITVGNLIFFGFLGLTFCYIASAPVLLLHAVRGIFTSIDHNGEVKNTKWFIVGILVILIIFSFTIPNIKYNGTFFDIIISNLLSLTVAFQLILLSIQMFRKNLYSFYKELTQYRSTTDEQIKDYKESYKHLREHGNAFMIVFFEIILGGVYSSIPLNGGSELAIKYTLLWIMPACCVWGIGTYLEMKIRKFNQP